MIKIYAVDDSDDYLDSLTHIFSPYANEYNLISQNCNHFCQAFSRKLLNRNIPSYVNRAANIGYYLSCLLPKSVKGLNPIPSEGGER